MELILRKSIKFLMFSLIQKIKNFENKILFHLKKHKISFICLAGYMKIISDTFIKNFRGKNHKYSSFSITEI